MISHADIISDNEAENPREAEQPDIASLLQQTRPRKKKRRRRPCAVTMKASVDASYIKAMKISAISVGVTTVVFILLFMLILYPITKKLIFSSMNEPQNYMGMVAVYDLTQRKLAFEVIMKELVLIEKGVVDAQRKVGVTVSSWNRLTTKEFEDTATLLYIYSTTDNLEWRAYISNRCAETGWNKNTRSAVGALGVDQLMPYTFNYVNTTLGKFDTYEITNVYHNTQAGIKYWLLSKAYLKNKLGRNPTVRELAMAYNMGYENYGRYVKLSSKEQKRNLSFETWRHGFKAEFYYDNICKKNYEVVWDDKMLESYERKVL